MKRFLVLPAVLMIALSGCTQKVDVEAERTALRQTDADWAAAVASKNVEAFTSYFASDAVVMAPHLPAFDGIEAIRQWATDSMALPGFAVTWEATSAEVAASGDIGYTLGKFTFHMTMPDGTPMDDRGNYATVWRKQADGAWKVVVDIFNSEVQLMPMAAPADTTAATGP
jgi:ketosteroid isomerase-like protein